MNTSKRPEVKEELAIVLETLDEAIWTKDELDSASITVDVIASLLIELKNLPNASKLNDSKKVFSALETQGLSSDAGKLAKDLADIASLNFYDDNEESVEYLEKAEEIREKLYQCLKTFVEGLE
jgi:hypothetical protein